MNRRHSQQVMLSLVTALTMAVALVFVSGAGTARAQGTVSVSIIDNSFDPGSITVAAGTTVVWTNNGANPHTVTADDGSFNSGTLDPGGTYSVTFNTPGTFGYVCTIHDGMAGTVVVTGGDDGDTGDGDGADDGDAAPPAQMPTTGAGTSALHDSTTMLIVLAGAATVLLALAMRQRRMV